MIRQRYLLLWLGVFFAMQGTIEAEESEVAWKGNKEDLHIYILIGQSNMAGRARLTDELKEPLDRVLLLNGKGKWVQAGNPLNRYSTFRKSLKKQGVNPGYGFSKALLERLEPSVHLGLISNARGTTRIAEWREGGKMFKDTMKRVKEVSGQGVIKGILWHQGETDAEKGTENYEVSLKALVGEYRAALGNESLPFVGGMLLEKNAQYRPFNEMLRKLAPSIQRFGLASSEGLSGIDRAHFDTESQLTLGRRYAELMIALEATP